VVLAIQQPLHGVYVETGALGNHRP
jgi:hypothetical protein